MARYSFSGPIPPKFEHKLRRHKQSFGKIATTVVLDKDENLLWSGLQRHWSCHSNEMTLLPKITLRLVEVGYTSCFNLLCSLITKKWSRIVSKTIYPIVCWQTVITHTHTHLNLVRHGCLDWHYGSVSETSSCFYVSPTWQYYVLKPIFFYFGSHMDETN